MKRAIRGGKGLEEGPRTGQGSGAAGEVPIRSEACLSSLPSALPDSRAPGEVANRAGAVTVEGVPHDMASHRFHPSWEQGPARPTDPPHRGRPDPHREVAQFVAGIGVEGPLRGRSLARRSLVCSGAPECAGLGLASQEESQGTVEGGCLPG